MLDKLCKEEGLNFYKVMCMRWQANTNQLCQNRNHKQDVYKDKMECEATLVEIVCFHLQFPTKKSAEALRLHLIK